MPPGPLSRRQFLLSTSGALTAGALTSACAANANPVDASPSSDGLMFTDGRILSQMMRARELSAEELMQATLAQIARVNPTVNAIPTLRPADELLAEARDRDAAMARGESAGPLHGIPIAVKDLADTKGIRTTQGSRIYRDFVPDTDEIFVERFRAAGAILIGKTNVPEFGAGSQTFNEVFGKTLNPYDLGRTCGGSSGGAAVSLACGMTALADGSDLGGSLRNPASFCNVVGFRPSPGRVPRLSTRGWNPLPVQGPMARTAADVAFLLSVMAGPDPRDPISLDEPAESFLRPLDRSFRGSRIGWSQNLGQFPVDPAVNDVCNTARPAFEELGIQIDDGEPDFSGAAEIFQILRAWGYANGYRDLLAQHRGLMKDTVIWNIERGLDLTAKDISDAETARTELYRRVVEYLEEREFLVLPVSQVPPFSVEVDWVREINGERMETYIDWMMSCSFITLTGLPAISIPAGFTPDGLPIGLQIVGRRHADFSVLQLAHAFEQVTRHTRRRPEIALA